MQAWFTLSEINIYENFPVFIIYGRGMIFLHVYVDRPKRPISKK